jgi:hypothetical protein
LRYTKRDKRLDFFLFREGDKYGSSPSSEQKVAACTYLGNDMIATSAVDARVMIARALFHLSTTTNTSSAPKANTIWSKEYGQCWGGYLDKNNILDVTYKYSAKIRDGEAGKRKCEYIQVHKTSTGEFNKRQLTIQSPVQIYTTPK